VRRRLSLDAALAKYPNATIQRVETDSDGVYEAHIVTTDSSCRSARTSP
jgi:hypothetical protein